MGVHSKSRYAREASQTAPRQGTEKRPTENTGKLTRQAPLVQAQSIEQFQKIKRTLAVERTAW